MKSHSSTLINRMIKAASRVTQCRYRVAAAGIDNRGRIIDIAVNSPRLPLRGTHAEERIMSRAPRSLRRIIIVRVGAYGQLLPIDPCPTCARIAAKLNVRIESIEETTP